MVDNTSVAPSFVKKDRNLSCDLLNSLQHFYVNWRVPEKENKICWIGYSGGLDSHVLLFLCNKLREFIPITFHVIHINHHISLASDDWAKHCALICQQLDMPYFEASLSLSSLKKSQSTNQTYERGLSFSNLEAVAREQRYAIFSNYLQKNDLLLTAHHQDDQAETLLLQLLRGSGLKGLASMPNIKSFANGFHGRPFLHLSRDTLKQFAEYHQLRWIEDESNQNTYFTRNFLRHEVMSVLKNKWSSVSQTLSRTAKHLAQTQHLLDEYVQEDYAKVKGTQKNTLSISKLLDYSTLRQLSILRYFIIVQNYPLPNTEKLISIQKNLLTAKQDRMPLVTWQQVEMRRYRDELYLLGKQENIPSNLSVSWNFCQPIDLPGTGLLKATLIKGSGLSSHLQEVKVGFRKGGEMIHLAKRRTHTLKNLFQEHAIPPWQRGRIPLLFAEERCIQAVGYFTDEDFLAKEDEMGWDVFLADN